MEWNDNTEISWKCNNWYERPDGLIEIVEFNGEKILLNNKLKDVWIAINYEATVEQVWNQVKEKMSRPDYLEILRVMEYMNLITASNMNDLFDQIFS